MAQYRNTVQKEQVYSAVVELKNHPTADEVYEKVRFDVPAISRATVYRILNQMADSGAITKISVPDGANRYDCQTKPHCHAVCIKCGKVFDLWNVPEINVGAVVSGGEFELLGCDIIFNVLCKNCK